MKILIPHRPGGAFGYITDGWLNALRDRGHQVRRYDGEISSWEEFDPDLYIGCSGHRQPIPSRRRAKVAIHVNPYGPVDVDGINESPENISWTVAQKPDAVFGYGFHSDRVMWSYWTKKHNIPWAPLPTAADRVIYHDKGLERDLDVVYLGGRWPYKAITIDSFLLPVLRESSIKYKLHGWGEWPSGFCDGGISEDQVVAFLNRGKVGPCISERHTQRYGIDVPERAWKLALCGVLVVHDPVPTLRSHFRSALIARDANEYKDLVIKYSRDENSTERLRIIADQKAEVLANHTYHNRMATLFTTLNFHNEAAHMTAM